MSLFANLGFKLLAITVALMLWGVSHSTSHRERGFDLPIELTGVPEDLVVTDQSTDTVNIRVRGSSGSLRRLLGGDLVYRVDLSGAKLGVTDHAVEAEDLNLPRGTQIVSRSPAGIEFTLSKRGRRAIPLKVDLTGTPAAGFKVAGIELEPARVWVSGPRSEVLRLAEVLTEAIEVNDLRAPLEKTVRPLLVGRHLWLEGDPEVKVRVRIEPEEPPPAEEGNG